MKIISGFLKGKTIKGYDIEGTRPTMDRVKESLFATIQGNIKDKVVLDLFAGTGNLGFEAISNGSLKCYFNDKNKKCINLINNMAKVFGIEDKAFCTNFDYRDALEYYKKKGITFDVIFLDPPYKMECLNEVLEYIKSNSLLTSFGIVVCEVDNLYLNFDAFNKIKEKKYGDKYIVIYKNNL